MRIGSVQIDNKTVLAPLAGITDLPFRLLAKGFGCGLVYSEMISSNGLVYKSRKTRTMLARDPAEKPLTVQLFGADPCNMAEAARLVAASGADIIDINCGCSVKKVLKTGAGSALMAEPERAEAVFRAVRDAVEVPVTIKIRSGWDASGDDAFRMVEIANRIGLDAVAIHPRTARQGFSGQADWGVIAAVRRYTDLPVIGNGDVCSADDALRMLEETACDGVMIGRAAIGAPWIFQQVNATLNGDPVVEPSLDDRFMVMHRYLGTAVKHIGEAHACRIMRSRLGWFTKSLPHSAKFRESIKRIATQAEAEHLLTEYHRLLTQNIPDIQFP
ncbi:MAG: tRNA dihydrouridine synthase DusB [Thermodesulfobacteriota bacterium]|nr:tRNA dihydrouridine synthase DusB [Thermodesulfobacteriota bacterium]